MRLWGRALCTVSNGSARYTRAGHNKSLDASGISVLLIDNLLIMPLSPAASTQSFGVYRWVKDESSRYPYCINFRDRDWCGPD